MSFIELLKKREHNLAIMEGMVVEYPPGRKRGSVFNTRKEYLINKAIFLDKAIEEYNVKSVYECKGHFLSTQTFKIFLDTNIIGEVIAIIEHKAKQQVSYLKIEEVKMGVVNS